MNFEQSHDWFHSVFEGKKTDEEIESMLITLAAQGETFEQIAGAAKAMKEHALPLSVPFSVFDVCGTGGSGNAKTFNVSTTVAIIVASAGIKVAKHGNRAASSKSGSADVLECLHIPISNTAEETIHQLTEKNLSFLFAQTWHPAMKQLMPIRKKIAQRTIFNLLGPLTNPANPSRQVVGVPHKKYIEPMILALQLLGKKSAIVLCGEEGLDEASIRGKTYYSKFFDGEEISSGFFIPEQFGIRSCPAQYRLQGGTPEENANIITNMLAQKSNGSHEYNLVLLNAGIAFWIVKKTSSIEEGIALAEKQIMTGEALQFLSLLQH